MQVMNLKQYSSYLHIFIAFSTERTATMLLYLNLSLFNFIFKGSCAKSSGNSGISVFEHASSAGTSN